MNEQQRNKMFGVLLEHSSEFKRLPIADGQWVIENPKQAIALCIEAIKNRNKTMSGVFESEYLKLISGGKILTIDQCDGQRVIADAKDVFSNIDSDFRIWKADEAGQATPDTPVNVFELVEDGMFSEFFGSLTTDTDRLCFTQDQIIVFVKKYRNWLRMGGYATFFVFKSHGEFFVADALFRSDGTLSVGVDRLEDVCCWGAERRHRVVVPQLVA